VTDGESIAIPVPMRALLIAIMCWVAVPARAASGSSDPARGRYLLAPSAFVLHGGELVVSQTEALLSSAGLGIADHVEVALGSAAPALSLMGSNVANVTLAVKAGFSAFRLLHLAAGFQTLTFPGVTAGYTYAVATYGRERLNVSVGAGVPLTAVRASPTFGEPMMFAAGVVGLGKHVALATEHWWFPTLRNLSMINSGMVRFDVWRVSLGVGAAKVDALRIPLPWIDLSFRLFG
jgi:hypothetical protein